MTSMRKFKNPKKIQFIFCTKNNFYNKISMNTKFSGSIVITNKIK